MTSTRLPGKILATVCGRTLLDYHVSRLLQSRAIDKLVIATTVNKTDDPVEEYCQTKGIACVRGSENDVLARYYQAAQKYPTDIIVRVTSDCPLIDPILVDQVIKYFITQKNDYDYISLGSENFPRGLDVEVFYASALKTAHRLAVEPHEREHVTPYIYRPNSEFNCGVFPSGETCGDHRWCVDEPADLELISNILSAFDGRDDFTWQDCLALFDSHPEWYNINWAVKQKHFG